MTKSERERAMEAKLAMFREGVYLVFSRWSVLQLAIKYDLAEDGTSVSRAVFVRSHMSSAGAVTLLNPDLFWRVQSGTRHWAA